MIKAATRLPPRIYLHVLATAEDADELLGWARTQAMIHRKDADVVSVDATLVVDSPEGQPIARTVEV